MKIALLTDGIYPYVVGGMQRHSYYLCKYLLNKGIQIDLYHTQWERSFDISTLHVFSEEEKKNLRSFVIPWPKSFGLPGHYLRASYKYSKAIYQEFTRRSLDADFVYAKGFAAWKLLEEKKKGLYIAPVGLKMHGYEMYQLAPDFKTRLQHLMLRKAVRWNTLAADYVFSYGGKISDIIRKIGVKEEKIFEIPSGIESGWLNNSPLKTSRVRRFVFLGRYERRKGIEEITSCIRKFISDDIAFEFHFIGPIPKDLNLEHSSVIYHGKVLESEAIQALLRAADVLVCPSYSEGMPNSILEAMASGLYIIASDVGAVNQLVDERNGQLIPPANTDALLKAMQKVLAMPDSVLLRSRKNSLLKIQQSFLWTEIIQKTLRKIEKINGNSVLIS